MPIPIIYAENAIEGAILTMSPGPPVTGKGTDRLVDRDIGLECEDSGTTGTRIWHADRGVGASNPMIAAWIFTGSNYAGTLVELESSPDNAAWTPRGAITPTSDTTQRVTVTPFTVPRYVRWKITSPAAPVRFTEVFLSPRVSLVAPPIARATREPLLPNTVVVPSQSGRSWGVQRGARRWSTEYLVAYGSEADRLTLFGVLDALQDGARPCWLYTAKGEFRWVRISGDITLEAADGLPVENWAIPLRFVEELT